MKKILILGCAGCGKSTLAKLLGKELNIPVIHLDRIFWKPGWEEEDKEVFFRFQQELVREDSWIIDGNYRDSLDLRLAHADTVIYLDYPRRVALRGIFKRYFEYHNKERDTIGEGCKEKIDREFFMWVWNFKKKSKSLIINKINNYSHLNVLIFKNRQSLNDYLKTINIDN